MAIDLDAVRRKMAELSGVRRNSVNFWKPTPGEYRIRVLPWPPGKTADGTPFVERWFYYIGDNQGILTPKQFGKPDPIDAFIRKLFSTKNKDDKEMAKKLMPNMRAYAPIIVRGQEDKGVMLWSFGKGIYQKLLGFILDEEDFGDIQDPNKGFDLKVVITKTPGKQYQDTDVSCKPKSCKLSDDPKQMQDWLAAVPDVDAVYKQKSAEEIENVLNNWLSSGGPEKDATDDEGTARGAAAPKNEVDELVNAVKFEATAKELPVARTNKVEVQSVEVDKPKPRAPKVAAEVPQKKQTLDEAFDELLNES